MKNQAQFLELREKHKTFTYKGYTLVKKNGTIFIEYNFTIDGLAEFHPALEIPIEHLTLVNDFDSRRAKEIIFSLGMVELISYWKAACPKKVVVACGYLDSDDIYFWKKLYYNGLGEFFYINGIETDFDSFMSIEVLSEPENKTEIVELPYNDESLNLIPVGGGKDSNVTLELLQDEKELSRIFIINPRGATIDSAKVAGYDKDKFVTLTRTIDKELLALNAKGYLNGHTPFSAVVAFASLYCSYLIGAVHIVLSNESSANEGNIAGLDVNHQYSKSYAFETDFGVYIRKNMTRDIDYFSLLRSFNELQIAAQFSGYPKYFNVFKSCNVGSKENIWCTKCSKCLFVFLLFFPFLQEETLVDIFGVNMFKDDTLKRTLDDLAGFTSLKPFECVGTAEEVRLALDKSVRLYQQEGQSLPALLAHYNKRTKGHKTENSILLREFHTEHHVPEKFMGKVKEMYRNVSKLDTLFER